MAFLADGVYVGRNQSNYGVDTTARNTTPQHKNYDVALGRQNHETRTTEMTGIRGQLENIQENSPDYLKLLNRYHELESEEKAEQTSVQKALTDEPAANLNPMEQEKYKSDLAKLDQDISKTLNGDDDGKVDGLIDIGKGRYMPRDQNLANTQTVVTTPAYYRDPASPAIVPDPKAAAERVLKGGERPFIKDNYEARMKVFAEELGKGDATYQAELVAEVIRRDSGAFDSWLKAHRVNELATEGYLTTGQRDTVFAGMKAGIESGRVDAAKVSGEFVRDTHDPSLIATYIARQDKNTTDGLKRAVIAFTGVSANDMRSFIANPTNKTILRDFTLAVQHDQRLYETLTLDRQITATTPHGSITRWVEAPIEFSKEQLQAMRDGFKQNDGLVTDGELLLAYPDRTERNEAVTDQYYELSKSMGDILGMDNANWASYAVWASDEIGRNLQGGTGMALGELGGGDPRFWLSKGNSMLVSDIGPGFQYFTEVFSEPSNHKMSFEDFWKGFENKWGGRGISYLDGKNDPEFDMKNAFKAFYEAMHLQDKAAVLRQSGGSITEIDALDDRRGQLMLYGNTLVGLQEQYIIQKDIEEGMSAGFGLVVDPLGSAAHWVNLHLPGDQPGDARQYDTNRAIPPSGNRPHLDITFEGYGADGQSHMINLETAVYDRLSKLLDGEKNPRDLSSAPTPHWEDYGKRMNYIYHFFAEAQHDPRLFNDPRAQFESRAEVLNNNPRY